MNNGKYSLSFTVGGLFLNESIRLIELYLKIKNWDQVKKIAIQDNILQYRTISTAKRIIGEISSRLELLNDSELEMIEQGDRNEQIQLLWFNICLRYEFIKEFAIEIIREKYLSLQRALSIVDYDSFYNTKALWNDSLEDIKPATRNKLRQVLFKILREAEIIDSANNINATIIGPRVLSIILARNSEYLNIFPLSEQDILVRIN